MRFLGTKFLASVLVISLILGIYFSGMSSYLSLGFVQENLAEWKFAVESHAIEGIAVFVAVYVISTALSLPGAALLTLLGGALFGMLFGFIWVSFASTMGATLSFLMTRYVFRDWVEGRFPEKLRVVNEGMDRDGTMYLLSLRLAPVIPFFLVNILMGLTRITTFRFFVVSQLGMMPGTLAYVYAGRELSQISSLSGIMSPPFILALFGLALTPWFGRWLTNQLRNYRLYKDFRRPKTFDYNLIVIGAGAGGLVTSYIAAAAKAKVALVESHKMGGDCLNYGCVPSKALIKSARMAYETRHADRFGIRTQVTEVDFSFIMGRLREVIREIEPHDSVERYTQLGVDCFYENAFIQSPYEVKIGNRVFTTKAIVVASGARPFVPPIPGIEKVLPLTSETLWKLESLPKKLLIMGGGAIGCELAQAFQRLGSQVTLVEKFHQLMPAMDNDVSKAIEEQLVREGVDVITSGEVIEFTPQRAHLKIGSRSQDVGFDQLIFALGRKARVEGFGLEELGIMPNNDGFISHDEFLATKFPNIFVCGDCAGPYQLTHVAAHQAWVASINSLLSPFKKFKQDLRVIPSVTFVDPQLAHVGLTEKSARDKNIEIEVTKYEISDLDRAICDGERAGFIKIITAKGSDKILGATILASHSGEYLSEFVFAMKNNLGLNKILSTIHSYPTWAESNKFVAGRWKSQRISPRLLKFAELFHTWRRS